MDKIFHFQLGKILLATVTPSDIKTMLNKDWPYFSHYSQEIDQCLNNASCQGIIHLYFLGSFGTSNKVSFHLPHLIDSSGSLTPAALIPFCAYQTNTTLLGQTRQDLPFTACSQFQPTILEGQRCYSLNLTAIDTGKAGTGKGA